MNWQVILVLLITIPIILIPVMLVWYINIGGIYAAAREGARFRVFQTISRIGRTAIIVIVPLGIYVSLIWFFLSYFGWQAALAVALALPFVLLIPVLVWATVVSGLYLVIRETLRQRATAPRRRVAKTVEEPIIQEVLNK